MRGLCCYIALVLGAVLLQACGKADAYSQEAKTADSLSGAVSAMVKELEKTDTALLQKAITRFSDYRQFIRQNLNDTILKTEADNLQHFYAGGEQLQRFYTNRRTLLARANLLREQLRKLSDDIKNKALDAPVLLNYIRQEQGEATRLMEAGYDQQKKFHTGFEEFKNALPGAEQLIRSRNRGELPTIIKDSTGL